ncbi:T9SS type B sorting domain-containing protein [Pontibacter akesuensis]|uniref:Gliding motility-associated C-terminal domain-containing protein n=1 Tax=Pontibacter akesuensis TaxID=388950 RepID=A0A1I7GCQ6_9BACT|nr:gliding motility-associated C-terminal domain-containing protein [Pontibacter akesuensis]GHA57608.1 hypothetical protein GCM10007389_06650 [Pontibacter akesuensis]SFU46036.1 gliding motility-associated C-terminal domain-containing protein [Pontibacter akesuensis]
MKYLLSIFFLLLTTLTWAQNKCFKAYNSAGDVVQTLCVGQEYSFQDCGNEVDDDKEYYVFNYTGGTAYTTPTSTNKKHTYTSPGRYRVLQIANYGGTIGTDTVSHVFEVKASPEPTFAFVRCASGIVSFTVTDANYDSYTLDFGDGNSEIVRAGAVVEHTYTSVGPYTATLTGSITGGQCSNASLQQVEPLPVITAANQILISKLTVQEQATSGRLQLELSGLVAGYTYVVERYTGGIFSPYEEVGRLENVTGNTQTHTVSNVNTSEGTWFLVRPVDACGKTSLNSTIVSSILLQATINEEEVTLNWSNLPEFEAFDVYRNGTLLQTLPGTSERFIDRNVDCGQTYTYYVTGKGTTYQGKTYTSVTAPLAVTVTSTKVPATPYLLASFNLNNQVELTLQEASGAPVQVATFERSIKGAPYQQVGQAQQLAFTDTGTEPQPVCYRATLTNACGNTSPVSNVACPIILKAEKQVDGSVNLSWTAYTGFPNGAGQYTVELLDENGAVAASYPVNGTSYSDRVLSTTLPQLRYRIKATSRNGTGLTYSNLQVLEQEATVFLPSAFTPNGDGLNDVFEVKGNFFSGYTLRVYNQSGAVVFEGTEADAAWDGTHQGKKLLPGAYAYIITIRTSFGVTKQKTGTITLLR